MSCTLIAGQGPVVEGRGQAVMPTEKTTPTSERKRRKPSQEADEGEPLLCIHRRLDRVDILMNLITKLRLASFIVESPTELALAPHLMNKGG